MKFVLDLNEETVVKYARHLGYEEDELKHLNEDESFIDALIEIIENTCEYA